MRRNLALTALVMLALLLVSACGGGAKPAAKPAEPAGGATQEAAADGGEETPADGGEETPADGGEETPADSGEEAPADGGEETTGGAVSASTGLDQLDSYRMTFNFSFNGTNAEGADDSGTMDMLMEANNVDGSRHMMFTMSGPAFEDESMGMTGEMNVEMFQFGDESYMLSSMTGTDQCSMMPGAADNTPIDPNEMIGELEGAKLVAEGEDVNGVMADHYMIDETGKMLGIIERSSEGTVDYWVAQDGGYLVKLDAEAAGEAEDGTNGTFVMHYELSEVNALGEIVLPEACENALDLSAPPEGIEMPEDGMPEDGMPEVPPEE